MAPVSKLLLGGVALATLQGCGGPNKVTNLDTKVDIPVDLSPPIAPVTDVDDENDDAGVQSNDAQIVVKDKNIGEISDANTLKSSGQVMESDGKIASRYVEDLQKKTQQIWNAVMSKKGGAIAAGVALTGTLATAIGYKVKQHRAQAGRTCTAVGEGVSNKFVGVRYYDGQKVNFECATGYTLTDDEVTVECDANGEARITACSKNTILGYPLRKIVKRVAFPSLAGGLLAYGAWRKFTETQKFQENINDVKLDIDELVKAAKENYQATDKEIIDLVDKYYAGDASSISARAFATHIGLGDSSDKNKETAEFVNKQISEKINDLKLEFDNLVKVAKADYKANDKPIIDLMDKYYAGDASSLSETALTTHIGLRITGVDDAYIRAAYAERLANFVNQKKLQENINDVKLDIDELVKVAKENYKATKEMAAKENYQATDKEMVAKADYKANDKPIIGLVDKYYAGDASSISAKALAKHIGLKDSSDKNKETLCKESAEFVNKQIADELNQQ